MRISRTALVLIVAAALLVGSMSGGVITRAAGHGMTGMTGMTGPSGMMGAAGMGGMMNGMGDMSDMTAHMSEHKSEHMSEMMAFMNSAEGRRMIEGCQAMMQRMQGMAHGHRSSGTNSSGD